MSDWFNDPFFQKSQHNEGLDSEKIFQNMNHHFEEMHRFMRNMWQDTFSIFRDTLPPLEPPKNEKHSQPTHNESNYEHPKQVQPIIQEPDENIEESSSKPRSGFYYSAMTTSFNGANGICHTRRKTHDSSTGITKMAETRQIGDQVLTVKREITQDGKVTEAETRQNIKDEDLDSFRKRWDSQKNTLPYFGRSHLPALNSSQKALK